MISRNTISHVGYIGIRCDGVNNAVTYNQVDNVCTTLDDCGAIYAWGTATKYLLIQGNFVHDGYGNRDGTPGAQSAGLSEGIYLDDGSSFATITNNVVWNFPNGGGIKVHNHHDAVVAYNLAYGTQRGIGLSEDNLLSGITIYNTSIHHNELICTFSSCTPLEWSSTKQSGIPAFGSSDFNVLCNPYSGAAVTADSSYTLSNWQTSGLDLASIDYQPNWSSDLVPISQNGGNLINNPEFDLRLSGWGTYQSTLSLDNSSALSGVNSGFVTYGSLSGLANTASFDFNESFVHRLRFQAKSVAPVILLVRLNMAVSPWGGVGYQTSFAVGANAATFETVFNISNSQNPARFDFQVCYHPFRSC